MVREFVGAKLDLPPGVLTPEEVESRLAAGGLPEATAGEVRELLVLCELRRWARAEERGAADSASRDQVLERARALVARVDEDVSRGSRGGST